MKRSGPHWYNLIKLFKAAEPPYIITTGLTIPFLFGAYKILGEPFKNINQLVKVIIDSEVGELPIIHRCPEIDRHVILTQKKEYCNRYYAKYARIESESANNRLLISDTAVHLGKTFDKLCNGIHGEYQKTIDSEEYSYSKKTGWRKFEEGETEIIKNLMQSKGR